MDQGHEGSANRPIEMPQSTPIPMDEEQMAASSLDEASSYQEPSSPSHEQEGGRLWKLAGEEVARRQAEGRSNTPSKRLANSFLMSHMKSRAEVDASPPSSNVISKHVDAEDEAFIVSTKPASKRVRVVQLLVIGLFGLLLGWLGNFFVASSCHFASVLVQVGQYGDEFSLHFGLWKYSPADSAVDGFTYCTPYADSHEQQAPIVPRIANLLALLLGTFGLGVLWVYLITGRTNTEYWNHAITCSAAAGALQCLTLFFFVGRLCRDASCSMGPAAWLAIVTSLAWILLAAELYYQTPIPHSESVLKRIEMSDLQDASQEYMERVGYRPPSVS